MTTFAASAPGLPFDVRLMNGVASLLYGLVGVALLAAALLWLSRSPWLAIRVIQLEGDLQRNNVSTLRANAAPRLNGNLLSIDLDKARAAFEAVPWVRQATLRRVWPDRLAVRLAEHQTVALWLGEDGTERLVNAQGEVFSANVGDVEDQDLPLFSGPDGTSAQMLALYLRLAHPGELRPALPRHRGGKAAGGRCCHPGQDEHGRVRHGFFHGELSLPGYPQSLGPGARPGWI